MLVVLPGAVARARIVCIQLASRVVQFRHSPTDPVKMLLFLGWSAVVVTPRTNDADIADHFDLGLLSVPKAKELDF
jgi:hypothetical protein